MLKNMSNFYHKLMIFPDQVLIFLLIRLLLIYMPDVNSLSNLFAKIFIVLYRNMKNLS